ncbi:MAG TPA: TetR/AcrR family transcriptional regulator, partial [Saprospiraceae bacterium]|nr:TetR/AcrR family transcriptional regulator [Saprospiraceae bacterium]
VPYLCAVNEKAMAKIDQSTEEKIKEAAKKIFIEKGFGSTTTRDIAERADTNIALVNYYFRSKEKLFQEIFRECFIETFLPVARILNDDLPLEAKIYKFVDHMTELLKHDPLLPMFVFSEIRSENSKICEVMTELHAETPNRFQHQLEEEAAKGNIRKTNFDQVETSLMAMVIFPFLSMNMMKMKKNMSTEDFYRFVDERKKCIPEMILTYLRHQG